MRKVHNYTFWVKYSFIFYSIHSWRLGNYSPYKEKEIQLAEHDWSTCIRVYVDRNMSVYTLHCTTDVCVGVLLVGSKSKTHNSTRPEQSNICRFIYMLFKTLNQSNEFKTRGHNMKSVNSKCVLLSSWTTSLKSVRQICWKWTTGFGVIRPEINLNPVHHIDTIPNFKFMLSSSGLYPKNVVYVLKGLHFVLRSSGLTTQCVTAQTHWSFHALLKPTYNPTFINFWFV